MRLDKIYTKVGDKGRTLLANGVKVKKSSSRIHSYGTVDELNSSIALLRDFIQETAFAGSTKISSDLRQIQNELFDIGGELATPTESLDTSRQQVIGMASITRLENQIDKINENLPPLTNFILPGGHRAVSQSHMCRCICRRAERLVCGLSSEETVRTEPQIYLNRLSDWLFVVSRQIAKDLDINEILWEQKKGYDEKDL